MKTSKRSAPARRRAPSKGQERDLGAIAVSEQPLFDQFVRIGGGVNPITITGIIRDADLGRTFRLVDLMHEFRQKDGHLQSVLQRREQAISKLDVQCTVSEKAKARDRKGADILERALKKAKGFRENIAHLVGESCLFGHATTEVIWGRQGQYLVPVEFRRISARRFGFRMSDGALLFDVAGYGDVSIGGVDLLATHAPGKFIQVRRRLNGDVAVREGLARVLVWLAGMRGWDIRDWGQLAELGWKPWRKGGYSKGANDKDKLDLENALRYFAASGWVLYNKDTTEIGVEWPKNQISGVSTHKEFAEFLGMEMSKAVLCGTLTTESGQRGARSLGEVHEKGLADVIDGDEQIISEHLTTQLAAPFAEMNFGGTAEAAQVGLPHDESVDLKAFSEAIVNFRAAGLRIGAQFVRDEAGIPEPEDDEELLGPVEAEGQPGEPGKPGKPAATQTDDEQDAGNEDDA